MEHDEPHLDELPANAGEPATKGDLYRLERQMLGKMTASEQRILRHFDVAVENIEEALRGANADEISSMKDADNRLHERLLPLEQQAGIASPQPPHRQVD